MTSSAKRKKEKKKDFQKAKLKVGKAKPKPSNFTDTSFSSKSITIKEQSLRTSAPAASSKFSHHLSLLSSRSDAQRKESLAHLTTTITSSPDSPLPQSLGILLPKLLPLILDGSNGVRIQLLKLLHALPKTGAGDHAEQILLYARAGMTHLAVDVRRSALEMLDWAISACGVDLVDCPGGWVKTLKTFLTLLGWAPPSSSTSAWSNNAALPTTSAAVSSADKLLVQTLSSLASFLSLGLSTPKTAGPTQAELARAFFPLVQTWLHTKPTKSNPYGYLNLYGAPRDEESRGYDDVDERREVFQRLFRAQVESGVESARMVGGEVGRAAGRVGKVLVDRAPIKESEEEVGDAPFPWRFGRFAAAG